MNLSSLFPHTTYCERGDGISIFAEPVTAIANLAILISTFYIYRLLRSEGKLAFPYLLLPLFMLVTGLSSILWHSYPSYTTLILDSLSVVFFLLTAWMIYFQKMLGNYIKALLGVAILLAVTMTPILIFPEFFTTATERNILAIVVFIIILILSYFKIGKDVLRLMLPTALFIVAILFREIDMVVCSHFPIGTHFLWHIFNSIAAYFFVYFVLKLPLKQVKLATLEPW